MASALSTNRPWLHAATEKVGRDSAKRTMRLRRRSRGKPVTALSTLALARRRRASPGGTMRLASRMSQTWATVRGLKEADRQSN